MNEDKEKVGGLVGLCKWISDKYLEYWLNLKKKEQPRHYRRPVKKYGNLIDLGGGILGGWGKRSKGDVEED